jgi:hypothetical protein
MQELHNYSNECSAVTLAPIIIPDINIQAIDGSMGSGTGTAIISGSLAPRVVYFSSKSSYAKYSFTVTATSEYYLQGRFYFAARKGFAFSVDTDNATNTLFSNNKINGMWYWGNKVFLGLLQPGTYTFTVRNNRPTSSEYIDMLRVTTDPSAADGQAAVDPVELESEAAVFSNYPNPFNPETNIRFTLDQDEKVNISLYDILGNLVEEIANENMRTGMHEIRFKATGLASGVYILQMRTSTDVKILKMNLLK